ncbi:hypothetical protein MTR67_039657 [Solanum verrucosum]|uniref:Reverse transcriptase/retrotransposon-derived protein RNase H-like domain-containing protein n=1 Tax=Solanum verrucosum TaxID=315347 RepID=A0AAF0UHU1_SOLVR|nr:hypothetical protein MTR67_039657 [Solanum verrucosum]
MLKKPLMGRYHGFLSPISESWEDKNSTCGHPIVPKLELRNNVGSSNQFDFRQHESDEDDLFSDDEFDEHTNMKDMNNKERKKCGPGEIRWFTGLHSLISYTKTKGGSRRFVEGFSSISSPLTKLTQKKVKFQWSDECKKCFSKLKTRLTTTHVLNLPDGSDGFVIYCDASRVGVGCVLMQRYHKSLQYVFIQKEFNLRQSRWLEFLKDNDINVLYHPSKANVVVDALRKTTELVEVYAKLYIHEIDRLNGFPLSIISDRGPQFTFPFWKSLQKGLGTKNVKVTPRKDQPWAFEKDPRKMPGSDQRQDRRPVGGSMPHGWKVRGLAKSPSHQTTVD